MIDTFYIARDKNNALHLFFDNPPIRTFNSWYDNANAFTDEPYYLELDPCLFSSVSWEDNPIKVELRIKKDKVPLSKEIEEAQNTLLHNIRHCALLYKNFQEREKYAIPTYIIPNERTYENMQMVNKEEENVSRAFNILYESFHNLMQLWMQCIKQSRT